MNGIVSQIDTVGGIYIYTIGGAIYRTNALHYPSLTVGTEVEFDNPEYDYATNVQVTSKTQLDKIMEKLDVIEGNLNHIVLTLERMYETAPNDPRVHSLTIETQDLIENLRSNTRFTDEVG